jgi:hypothetical protein
VLKVKSRTRNLGSKKLRKETQVKLIIRQAEHLFSHRGEVLEERLLRKQKENAKHGTE